MSRILEILKMAPSAQSIDYVEEKQQFHLFRLLTEQRHPRTWNLSFTIQSDTEAGLRMLLSVDEDVLRKAAELAADPAKLEQAADAAMNAVQRGHRIYVYGCGATGRLAKQMESTFWRPFWRKVKAHRIWQKLKRRVPEHMEDLLIGELTGADRALVSSLEGFEDLQLIGRLQLRDHGIRRGDVVICVTEGGETSSVIGTILAAVDQYGGLDAATLADARSHLYFVYNNPDEVLRPFRRSVAVLDNPAITKLNLTTGPQAITGSTRMQATTIETFVVGVILEETIVRLLRKHLSEEEMRELGFRRGSGAAARLSDFAAVKDAVNRAVPELVRLTELEAETYRRGRFATYFARNALITVFTDSTERSPTFRLFPLDRVQERERHCWVQVWTEASSRAEAWRNFLGRPFKGLEESFYREAFEQEVDDPYLRESALRSLGSAGNDQEHSYDFSFSTENIESKGPQAGDLGVLALLDEELDELSLSGSSFHRFLELHHTRGARAALVLVTGGGRSGAVTLLAPEDPQVRLVLDPEDDPLALRRQVALKMLLNAHSTGIMASLGRVIGNTMTSVSPSNLKLIGRATYLVLSHVNDVLNQAEWADRHGPSEALTFAEANAVLMDAIEFVRSRVAGQTAEVALSIIRILEAVDRNEPVSWEQAHEILEFEGLDRYLSRLNPALKRPPSRIQPQL